MQKQQKYENFFWNFDKRLGSKLISNITNILQFNDKKIVAIATKIRYNKNRKIIKIGSIRMDLQLNTEDFFTDFSCNCRNVQKKSFKKNQIITTYIQKRNQICILLEGEADLVRYDLNGGKSIIEHFTKNDLFGEVFYIVTTNNELLIEAKKDCEVLFFIYDNIHKKCKNNCKFHQTLSEHFLELVLDKVSNLNTRIEVLTKRTIREKLLGYFSILSTRNLSKTFSMPFSLTDLADFLSVDRSAMMREIKNLKEEGFIEKNGNKITLLYK